jgi:adenylosuccinate synthase
LGKRVPQTDRMRRRGWFDTKQARRNSMAKKGTLAKCDELQPSSTQLQTK